MRDLNKECRRYSTSVLGEKQVKVQTRLPRCAATSCKKIKKREVFNKYNGRHIQEMEPNRYSRVLERLLLCLSTRHSEVTVPSGRIRRCTVRWQTGNTASSETKRNKEIQNWSREGRNQEIIKQRKGQGRRRNEGKEKQRMLKLEKEGIQWR